jgi:hypothetical protein
MANFSRGRRSTSAAERHAAQDQEGNHGTSPIDRHGGQTAEGHRKNAAHV